MRISAPFTWFGRVCLWIVLFPVGVWRSIRHSRKKTERKLTERFEDQLVAQPTDTKTPPRPEVG